MKFNKNVKKKSTSGLQCESKNKKSRPQANQALVMMNKLKNNKPANLKAGNLLLSSMFKGSSSSTATTTMPIVTTVDNQEMTSENPMLISGALSSQQQGAHVTAPLMQFVNNASERSFEYEKLDEDENGPSGPRLSTSNVNNKADQSHRAYISHLRKVISQSDVILHVLDARDPLGTRSTVIEQLVREAAYLNTLKKKEKHHTQDPNPDSMVEDTPDQAKSNNSGAVPENAIFEKKMVYILNKIDLLPNHVPNQLSYKVSPDDFSPMDSDTAKRSLSNISPMQTWIQYLRQFYPTIPLKANTQNQNKNLSSSLSVKQFMDISSKNALLNKNLAETQIQLDAAAADADAEYDGDENIDEEFCARDNSSNTFHSNHSKVRQQINVSGAIGTEELLGLLKNYARTSYSSKKRSITVGVVGYPNTGKSSLINSLKRARACTTGSIPGVTRHLQEVILDKNIKLIDCPGIVFYNGTAGTLHNQDVVIESILRNTTSAASILGVNKSVSAQSHGLSGNAAVLDVIAPVVRIMERCRVFDVFLEPYLSTFTSKLSRNDTDGDISTYPPGLLMLLQTYQIPNFIPPNILEAKSSRNAKEQIVYTFLAILAQKRGTLFNGGIPDFERTAYSVIKDWINSSPTLVSLSVDSVSNNVSDSTTTGINFPFYTLPPIDDQYLGKTELLTELAPAFDIDAFTSLDATKAKVVKEVSQANNLYHKYLQQDNTIYYGLDNDQVRDVPKNMTISSLNHSRFFIHHPAFYQKNNP